MTEPLPQTICKTRLETTPQGAEFSLTCPTVDCHRHCIAIFSRKNAKFPNKVSRHPGKGGTGTPLETVAHNNIQRNWIFISGETSMAQYPPQSPTRSTYRAWIGEGRIQAVFFPEMASVWINPILKQRTIALSLELNTIDPFHKTFKNRSTIPGSKSLSSIISREGKLLPAIAFSRKPKS